MTELSSPTHPVLPLRDIVVFPHMIVPLFVGREKSVRALEAVMKDDKQILLASQKDASEDEPKAESIYRTGVLANVLQLLKLPDGTVKVLVEGKARVQDQPLPRRTTPISRPRRTRSPRPRATRPRSRRWCAPSPRSSSATPSSTATSPRRRSRRSPTRWRAGKLADTVAGHLGAKLEEKQKLLEQADVGERLEAIYGVMQGEMSVLKVEKKIKSRVKTQMERTQREYYLNEQMKAIQRELGGDGEGQDDASEFEERIAKTKLSKEARDKAIGELKKLRSMSPMSAEATVVRNYLEWMLSIPWGKKSKIKKDLHLAQKVLDDDHYGLEKVKDRIVEFLAVQSRSDKLKGPILCLVGPPGVGKTSLGKSVARATGREFIRISLGGVRDEAEIRGHRRTYIGSMPGKIIQSMKKAKTTNPAHPARRDRQDGPGLPRRSGVGDARGARPRAELDLLGPLPRGRVRPLERDVHHHGQQLHHAAAALGSHGDHPDPRLHRGREDRDRQAAPAAKQEKGHGLKPTEFELTDEGLRDIIRYYTREAGVRNLEREIAKLCRKAVTEIVKGKTAKVVISPENLEEFLGVQRFKYGLAETDRPDRRRDRARLDRGRGRPALDRGAEAARQGADEDHRQARRRDEGVDRRRLVLRALQGAASSG